jgi:CSLREA domain-containing protein
LKQVASLVALVLCGSLIGAAGAGAASINVTSSADNKTDDQLCTLREAVDAANGNAAVNPTDGEDCPAGSPGMTFDTINVPAGTYVLTGNSGEDLNASGDLDFIAGGPVLIQGAALVGGVPQVIIDMNDADRAFDLQPGAGSVSVDPRNLELRDGSVGTDGGAVRIGDPDARFVTESVRFAGNHADDNGGAIYFNGGAIGSMVQFFSTEFNGNTASNEGGALWLDMPDQSGNPLVDKNAFVGNGAGTMGGAIYLETRATDGPVLVIVNSTLSGNTAGTGGGALAYDQNEGGNAYFRFTTIANNSTPTVGGGGAVLSNEGGLPGQFTLFSASIVAGNTAAGAPSNCAGPGDFDSTGYSIDSGSSCFTPASTDLVNTNPLIAPLALNPVVCCTLLQPTHGLYEGSPALNRVPDDGSCDFADGHRDQRFVIRDSLCDVGAFEGSVGPPPDTDGDGVPDATDNCPTQSGPASNGGCPVTATPAAGGSPAPTAVTKKCKKKKKKKRSAEAAKKKKCKKKRKKK